VKPGSPFAKYTEVQFVMTTGWRGVLFMPLGAAGAVPVARPMMEMVVNFILNGNVVVVGL
jgi:hypothetical protein